MHVQCYFIIYDMHEQKIQINADRLCILTYCGFDLHAPAAQSFYSVSDLFK